MSVSNKQSDEVILSNKLNWSLEAKSVLITIGYTKENGLLQPFMYA